MVTDAAKRAALADLYRRSFGPYMERSRGEQLSPVAESAVWLADRLHEVPVHVIPCIRDHTDGRGGPGLYGSIYPAVWSFQLALRSRGLGSVLTTLHLPYEGEAAELLGIPDGIVQAGLVPVAYYTGDDFKPARRRPIEEITYWDEWGATRS